ncbi:MAG: hypothetical protein HYS40_01060 [Gemmatimonadetes bacterium]|nr:hypothetical protein [Gemmatimonadota bacterium]
MDCAAFLDHYTEFRDGLTTAPRELRRFRRHLAACAQCRQYDTAVRRGVLALQALGTIEPSPDFRRRLDERLHRECAQAHEPIVPRYARVAAALLVAVSLTLLALEGTRRPEPAAVPALPPVAFPKPVANAGVPFVTFQDPRAAVVAGNPRPYGTAFVEPASAGR